MCTSSTCDKVRNIVAIFKSICSRMHSHRTLTNTDAHLHGFKRERDSLFPSSDGRFIDKHCTQQKNTSHMHTRCGGVVLFTHIHSHILKHTYVHVYDDDAPWSVCQNATIAFTKRARTICTTTGLMVMRMPLIRAIRVARHELNMMWRIRTSCVICYSEIHQLRAKNSVGYP